MIGWLEFNNFGTIWMEIVAVEFGELRLFYCRGKGSPQVTPFWIIQIPKDVRINTVPNTPQPSCSGFEF
jgi:hypothetical protein